MKFRKCLGRAGGRGRGPGENPSLDVSIQFRPQKEEKPRQIRVAKCKRRLLGEAKCCHSHRIGCSAGPEPKCFISTLTPEAKAWQLQNHQKDSGLSQTSRCCKVLALCPLFALPITFSAPFPAPEPCSLFILISCESFIHSFIHLYFFRRGLEGVQDLGNWTTNEQIAEASLCPTPAAMIHVFYFFSVLDKAKHTLTVLAQ